MNWINRINKAISYIEENITSDFQLEDIAQITNSSLYHFLRVFNVLTDKTLGNYITQRRLTLAAIDIINSDEKILDIAIKYQYESSEAFSRAFKRFHGISPSSARTSPLGMKATSPLEVLLTLTGGEKINYDIIQKNSFNISGPYINTNGIRLKTTNEIPNMWQNIFNNGEFDLLEKNSTTKGVMGVSYDRAEDSDDFKYMIGIESTIKRNTLHEIIQVPTLTWAIFPGQGDLPKAIIDLRKRIYKEWFSATDYIQVPGPDIEVYKNHVDEFEIWIPVECNNIIKNT